MIGLDAQPIEVTGAICLPGHDGCVASSDQNIDGQWHVSYALDILQAIDRIVCHDRLPDGNGRNPRQTER